MIYRNKEDKIEKRKEGIRMKIGEKRKKYIYKNRRKNCVKESLDIKLCLLFSLFNFFSIFLIK